MGIYLRGNSGKGSMMGQVNSMVHQERSLNKGIFNTASYFDVNEEGI